MTSQSGGSSSFAGSLLVGAHTVTAADHWLAMLVDAVRYTSSDLTPVIGSSLITVNTPGWYRVSAWANLIDTTGEDTVYGIFEGDNALYLSSTGFTALGPYPKSVVGAHGVTMQGMGFYQFTDAFKTMELQLHNPGAADQDFTYWIAMELLFGQ